MSFFDWLNLVISLLVNTKDEHTNDDDTKDKNNYLGKKNITNRNKEKIKKKTLNTKDHNAELNSSIKHNVNKSIDNNSTAHWSVAPPPKSNKPVFIFRDGMVKKDYCFYLNGWVFVYEPSSRGFESRCCHLNVRYRAFFEQGAPWHLGKYRA